MILDTTVYAGFYNIKQPGWFMVTVLPAGPLITQSNMIMVQYILMYLAFLVLALILAHYMSRSITNRISSVIHQMSKVRKGSLSPMESPVYHDEIGDLIDTYNYMTRKMDQLMADQAKAAEELRIAEFHSLQAQINPHFLYNTMDMINWLAQQGRTDDVSTAVQSLSRFYKLTLQPLIENAVLHGILEKDDKTGTIVLTGWIEDTSIVLLISDDGVGIPSEKLSAILSGNGNSTSGGTNIAVYNTHRRLQILYGPDYGLTYSSTPGSGTEVEIRIPAIRKSATEPSN